MNISLDEYPSIKEIHVMKDNELIVNLQRENILQTQLFPVGCIFKSFLSVLMGIAIKERRINSIEDSVLDYVKHQDTTEINWYKLKIKHALSKTTGLVWPGQGEEIPKNMDEVMKLNFESEPGLVFKYKPDPQIIVYLLESVYQCSIVELFESKLVKNFKNKEYVWNRDNIQDMQVTIGMLDELGQLMLHKGMIYGNEIFSGEYYNECITKYSNGGFPENTAYGLGWWLNKIHELPVMYAAGFGGQQIYIIQKKNICMSIVSDMDRPHPEYRKIMEQLFEL